MKLIGSKTGAYEYWIVFPNKYKLWMGVRKTSDTDVSIYGNESCDDDSLDVFYGLPWGPYVENGNLYRPEGFDYLIYSLINKARKNNVTQFLIDYHEHAAVIEEGSGNPIGEIILTYEKSNNVGGRYLDSLAKKQKKYFKKNKIYYPVVNNIIKTESK